MSAWDVTLRREQRLWSKKSSERVDDTWMDERFIAGWSRSFNQIRFFFEMIFGFSCINKLCFLMILWISITLISVFCHQYLHLLIPNKFGFDQSSVWCGFFERPWVLLLYVTCWHKKTSMIWSHWMTSCKNDIDFFSTLGIPSPKNMNDPIKSICITFLL